MITSSFKKDQQKIINLLKKKEEQITEMEMELDQIEMEFKLMRFLNHQANRIQTKLVGKWKMKV
jgi:hypothetical protein